jgi:DNA topoisomerase-1
MGAFESATQAKKNVVAAIKSVALKLGNTPSVCRKCYIHPAVLEAYLGGITIDDAKAELEEEIGEHADTLRSEERVLLRMLKQRSLLDQAA